MPTTLTDTQTIEAIKRIFEDEQWDSDAIAKVRELLPPTVATNDELYDAYAGGYDNGYVKGQGDLLRSVGAKHADELSVR